MSNEEQDIETNQETEIVEVETDQGQNDEDAQLNTAAETLASIRSAKSSTEVSDDTQGVADDPIPPAARKPRARKPRKAAAGPSTPTKVKNMMGDGIRFRFYKVDQLGKTALISDYSSRDLANADNDIELFIQMYLVKDYGEGSYKVIAFNGKNQEVMDDIFSVLAPKGQRPSASQPGSNALFEQGLVNSTSEQLRVLQDQMRAQEKVDREKAEKRAEELQSEMLTLRTTGGDSNNNMMMMMMMQNRADAKDAREERRRDELRREQSELAARIAAASAPQPLPPPPPPPPVDPLALMLPLLTLMKELRPEVKTDNSTELIYQHRIRDLERQQTQPVGIEDMFKQVNMIDQLAQQRYGPQNDSGVADVLKSFMDNFQGNMASLQGVIEAGGKQGTADDSTKAAEGPDLPPGFIEMIMELENVETDTERINTVLGAIHILGGSGTPKYEQIAKVMLKQIHENKSSLVLMYLKKMLEEGIEREMLSEETAQKTYDAFEANFEHIHRVLTAPSDDKKDAPEPEVSGSGDSKSDSPSTASSSDAKPTPVSGRPPGVAVAAADTATAVVAQAPPAEASSQPSEVST